MGFNIEFRDKEGSVVDWKQLDNEVCELWDVEPDSEHWAKHPGESIDPDWHEFLGRAVMLTRAFKETGPFLPSDLLQGLCSYGRMSPTLDAVNKYKYEIQLILYWMSKEYKIVVTNRW